MNNLDQTDAVPFKADQAKGSSRHMAPAPTPSEVKAKKKSAFSCEPCRQRKVSLVLRVLCTRACGAGAGFRIGTAPVVFVKWADHGVGQMRW